MSFCLKDGSRFHFYSVTCVIYSFVSIFHRRESPETQANYFPSESIPTPFPCVAFIIFANCTAIQRDIFFTWFSLKLPVLMLLCSVRSCLVTQTLSKECFVLCPSTPWSCELYLSRLQSVHIEVEQMGTNSMGRQVVKKVLETVFWLFHRPLGRTTAAQATRGTFRKHFTTPLSQPASPDCTPDCVPSHWSNFILRPQNSSRIQPIRINLSKGSGSGGHRDSHSHKSKKHKKREEKQKSRKRRRIESDDEDSSGGEGEGGLNDGDFDPDYNWIKVEERT